MIKYGIFILSILLSVASSASTQGLETNDVSFLFPLQQGRPYPLIPMAGAQPRLLEADLFAQILRFENETTDLGELPYSDISFVSDPGRWFVTSARIDDCGDSFDRLAIPDPSLGHDIYVLSRRNVCQPRVRLVLQPFNDSLQPLPSALHLLFNLTGTEMRQLALQLTDLKSASPVELRGQPLSLHPALVREIESGLTGPDSSYGSRLKALLLGAITSNGKTPASRLEVATMTISSDVMSWKMVGGYVSGGRWIKFVTDFNRQFYSAQNAAQGTAMPLGTEEIRCNFYEFCALRPGPVASTQSTTLNEALRYRPDGGLQAPTMSPAMKTIAEVIDDPNRVHFFSTNCASCHESANFRETKQLFLDHQPPEGVTPFTLPQFLNRRLSNVISFGYQGLSARVSTRVAAESAVVAARINSYLGLQNPGPRIKNLSGFWSCLMGSGDLAQCLKDQI